MFTIFTTEDIFCRLVRAAAGDIWLKILKSQSQIVMSRDPHNAYAEDIGEVIADFERSNEVQIYDESDYINSLLQHPEGVLQEPSGAFLLDISPQQAAAIQTKYGVICQSADALDDTVFTRDMSSISVVKGDREVTWTDLLFELENYPMNALMIIDRYLFCYESKHRSGAEDGIGNIQKILEDLLPQQLDCKFQVLVIFDGRDFSRNYDFSKVTTALNKIKKTLQRPYPIDIELVSMTNSCADYEATHDRRILSNYFKIEMPHLAKVFHRGIGEGVCSQDVTLKYLYSGANRRKGILRGLPVKGINHDMKVFRHAFDFARKAADNYEYGVNGNCNNKITECRNRLVAPDE